MPRLYACPACGARTTQRTCPEHRDHARQQRAARDARPDVRAKRNARPARTIYNTPRWRRLRAYIIDRDEVCAIDGLPGTDADPLTCGHIVALANGGDPWDEANLQAEHRSCNARKGAR